MPSDPTVYLYTSLTAGSSHIITATSRIETILKANKIPFKAVDCATDEKARMLWTRRSKGRKIPGLVKFNDVIADLEQVEEWNEHGELEDQIEDQIDIFGDVPISATSEQAHAAAAARSQAQEQARQSAAAGLGRTASETRHISISEPQRDKDQRNKSVDAQQPQEHNMSDKKDTPLSMAMKQAGHEAAAKAGQKNVSMSSSGAAATVTPKATAAPESSMPPPSIPASAIDPDAEEPGTLNTEAKTPEQLSKEGVSRGVSIDKVNSNSDGASDSSNAAQSTPAQIIEKRRQSSVPNKGSSLAKTTSIDESHTVEGDTSGAQEEDEDTAEEDETKKPAAKISATGTEEAKILKEKPQDTDAADGSKAGDSVAD
ncbi:hypothetical protein LTR05_004221 [Lithohypha guttulata]|uniref:Uncharacterized protein n=1 Tax=Lithohypha guttulata TaxID=1690604 RepID=A0AAN7T1G0_9EURO|nr:hypothetical protein LTR05_004221 [Lithohypha guttulata]